VLRVLGIPPGSRHLLLRELIRFEKVADTHVAPDASGNPGGSGEHALTGDHERE
jgi:hypothetical protein